MVSKRSLAVACLLIASACLNGVISRQSKLNSFKPYGRNKGDAQNTGTERPVIGIVSQTLEAEMKNDTRFDGYNTYIMKSYVDWAEAVGARVIPLINGEPQNETLDKLSRVNAVIFPGGDGDYLEYGRFVFQNIKEINDNGTYLPLWGTCMGYENMVSYVADEGWNVLGIYDLDSASLTMDFVVDPQSTKLYQWLGNEAYLFNDHNVTYHSHHWSMDPEKFNTDKGLSSMFKLTAISYMPDGKPIVASIESEQYPFFGTQFHPEKPTQIFKEDQAVNHSWISIQLNTHFAEYFVYQARRNYATFGNYSETQKAIIQNYDLIVTDDWYDIVYVFK